MRDVSGSCTINLYAVNMTNIEILRKRLNSDDLDIYYQDHNSKEFTLSLYHSKEDSKCFSHCLLFTKKLLTKKDSLFDLHITYFI